VRRSPRRSCRAMARWRLPAAKCSLPAMISPGLRVEFEEFTAPLLDQMVGHHEHRFPGQPHAPHFIAAAAIVQVFPAPPTWARSVLPLCRMRHTASFDARPGHGRAAARGPCRAGSDARRCCAARASRSARCMNAAGYFMMRARDPGLVIDSASLYSPGTSSSMVGRSSLPAVIWPFCQSN